jgi:hypothetical protein
MMDYTKSNIKYLADTSLAKKEQSNLVLTINTALERQSHLPPFTINNKVTVPTSIREAYFNMFVNSVEKRTIQHGIYSGNHNDFKSNLERQSTIQIYGRSIQGANFVLNYYPEKIDLEISHVTLKGNSIQEIGLFITSKDQNGNFQTELKVGEKFSYNSGFGGNLNISKIIDKIQNSEIIPHISIDFLKSLDGWEKAYMLSHIQ